MTLTKFYAKDFPSDFYSVLQHITKIALANSQYNNDEYIKELFTLFTTLPSVCSSMFNADQECISDVLRVCEIYIHTGSLNGKSACFRFLNRLLQLETDNDQVFSIMAQGAPQLLQLVITECISWERPVLRLASTFIFYLLMVVLPQPQERSKTVVDMIASHYPETFTQDELVKIMNFFSM